MENYQETVQYLYDLQFHGIKLGLKNISELLAFLGHPQKEWPAVHIAGTNGKGSTAAFIYSILRTAGYRVGLYTSPHLVDFSERIRVNEENISWETIVQYARDLKPEIEKIHPTFFEATSAIAFRYFAEQKIDVAVVETGLGGRLDATNLVNPELTVITPISADHEQFLGKGLVKIAGEKAGIIKPGIPCVTNNTDSEILKVFREKCRESDSPFYAVYPENTVQILEESIEGSRFQFHQANTRLLNLQIQLAGRHQVYNAALAISAVQMLKKRQISEENIRAGLATSQWPARMQIIIRKPLALLDVAHNPEGFKNILEFLKRLYPDRNIHLLFGLAKDKDFATIAEIIKSQVTSIGLVKNFSDKAQNINKLDAALSHKNLKVRHFENIETGYKTFLRELSSNEIILVIGSHYLAGEFIKKKIA